MKLPPMLTRLLWFKSKPPVEQEKEIQAIMRRVFCDTPDGAIALSTILEDLYWNRKTKSTDEAALRNYATILLRDRLGITTDTLATTVAIINNTVHKE